MVAPPFYFMTYVITTCEKNLVPVPANVVTIPAGVSTPVIPDDTNIAGGTAAVTIQNIGTNPCFYAFGQTCDGVSNIHGMLAAGVQLNVPGTFQVQVYSTLGTTIAVCILSRIGV